MNRQRDALIRLAGPPRHRTGLLDPQKEFLRLMPPRAHFSAAVPMLCLVPSRGNQRPKPSKSLTGIHRIPVRNCEHSHPADGNLIGHLAPFAQRVSPSFNNGATERSAEIRRTSSTKFCGKAQDRRPRRSDVEIRLCPGTAGHLKFPTRFERAHSMIK